MAHIQLKKSKQIAAESKSKQEQPVKLELPLMSQVYGTTTLLVPSGPSKEREKKSLAKRTAINSLGQASKATRGKASSAAQLTAKQSPPTKSKSKLLKQSSKAATSLVQSKPSRTKPDVRSHIDLAQSARQRGLQPDQVVVKDFPLPQAPPKQPRTTAKSPEKTKADGQPRIARTKTLTLSTKTFFDKYLTGAYDLSTPEGVRQLEEHFFPSELPTPNPKEAKPQNSGQVTRLRKLNDKKEESVPVEPPTK